MLHGEEWIQCIDGSWSALLPKCIGKPATLDGMFFTDFGMNWYGERKQFFSSHPSMAQVGSLKYNNGWAALSEIAFFKSL